MLPTFNAISLFHYVTISQHTQERMVHCYGELLNLPDESVQIVEFHLAVTYCFVFVHRKIRGRMAFAISEILKQTKLQVTIKAPNQYKGKHHLSFTASNSDHPWFHT